jgi:hypothetical protein
MALEDIPILYVSGWHPRFGLFFIRLVWARALVCLFWLYGFVHSFINGLSLEYQILEGNANVMAAYAVCILHDCGR